MPVPAPSASVAVFVKTPGLSPVKTRLGQAIGTEAALETYRICLAAVTSLLQASSTHPGFFPYWAVAEEEATALPLWKEFPRIVQPQSPGLAPRLHGVYSSLLQRHPGGVFLIGADCPHLPLSFLKEAHEALTRDDCLAVVGPATDGGFTLFGSREELPLSFWESITYSSDNTLEQLLSALKAWQSPKPHRRIVHPLPALTDIDSQEDLKRAWSEIESFDSKTTWPEQQLNALKRLRRC